jgi:hypothetical protein
MSMGKTIVENQTNTIPKSTQPILQQCHGYQMKKRSDDVDDGLMADRVKLFSPDRKISCGSRWLRHSTWAHGPGTTRQQQQQSPSSCLLLTAPSSSSVWFISVQFSIPSNRIASVQGNPLNIGASDITTMATRTRFQSPYFKRRQRLTMVTFFERCNIFLPFSISAGWMADDDLKVNGWWMKDRWWC